MALDEACDIVETEASSHEKSRESYQQVLIVITSCSDDAKLRTEKDKIHLSLVERFPNAMLLVSSAWDLYIPRYRA